MVLKKTLIILATHSQSSQLETDIANQQCLPFLRWQGIPKALLPISLKPAFSWSIFWLQQAFSDIYLVTNALSYPYYERWAANVGLHKANILNCGLSEGPIKDLAFVERVKSCQTDIVVISSEFLCAEHDTQQQLYSEIANGSPNQTIYSNHGLPIITCISLESLRGFAFSTLTTSSENATSLSYMTQLANHCQQHAANSKTITIRHDTSRYLIESLTLEQYLKDWISLFEDSSRTDINCRSLVLNERGNVAENDSHKYQIHQCKSYARVALMGNPSDGFYGKTLSLSISNFWAQVTLIPNNIYNNRDTMQHFDRLREDATIEVIHKWLTSPLCFPNLNALAAVCDQNGYDNGDRLLLACCKVFLRYCQYKGITLNEHMGFRLTFETNIPRQVGLAGSSAIVTACWKALTQFYKVPSTQIPPEIQANLVLSVEVDELGITAGLQDRVIQAYGGLVYMDFDKERMDIQGYGCYEELDVDVLPPLWLAYVAHPEDSGKVHKNVKERFLNGDQEVITAMQRFAAFTVEAKTALEQGDHARFGGLMTSNFELRRAVYGDDVVGEVNLRMVDIVRQHGGHAKFSGSGGAIVIVMFNKTPLHIQRLQWELEKAGYVFMRLNPLRSQNK